MTNPKVILLKKMLKGLTSKKHFDPDSPYCVIGENLYKSSFSFKDLFTKKETLMCLESFYGSLTHASALAMIRRAIKRWSK